MPSSGFNPALYVVDSGDDRVIDLPAKILWMQAERPGWRLTSDGLQVFAMDFMNDEGTLERKNVAVLHVAVINNLGQRIASYPVSMEVDSPTFAGELFEDGATLALDMLGFSIHNITTAQWSEATGLNIVVEAKSGNGYPGDTAVRNGVLEDSSSGEEGGDGYFNIGDPLIMDEPGKNSPSSGNDAPAPKLTHIPVEYAAPDNASIIPNDYNKMFAFFVECTRKNPAIINAKNASGGNLSERDLQSLFDRYLYNVIGADFYTSTPEERAAVYQKLLKDTKGKS